MKTIWVGITWPDRGDSTDDPEVGPAFAEYRLAQIWAATGPHGRSIHKIVKIETEKEVRDHYDGQS